MNGLGVGDPSEVGSPEALLRDAGALLRALTTGLTATMIARAQFKSELRLGVTTIRRTENNPFKFCASPEEALERLLLRPNPAYLPALEAARGAFEDIQAHEMAMIAGLRAALRALLARFEPGALEARLDAASGLDRLLPMARKSRYWDLFTETYEQVAADAAEDFMQLFGEAFTRAYEDQILRLGRAREQQPK
jgi:type VI secretion system FHA domain protein